MKYIKYRDECSFVFERGEARKFLEELELMTEKPLIIENMQKILHNYCYNPSPEQKVEEVVCDCGRTHSFYVQE